MKAMVAVNGYASAGIYQCFKKIAFNLTDVLTYLTLDDRYALLTVHVVFSQGDLLHHYPILYLFYLTEA